MSTTNKLTYLNTTKQELKQAINNLGGDITDETTFRQYVNQLDNVYDVLPKTSFQEGTEVTIEGGLKGKIDFDDGKVGFGQASQESTTGKNVFNVVDLRDYNATSNDATITKKINEISFVSGSSNTSGFYTSKSYWSNYIQNYVEGTTYKVSADIVATQNTTIKFGNDVTTPVSVVANTKTRLSFDLTAGAIVCYNTNQTSGITIKVTNIMFSTSSDTTYEQYSGGYASPSPNWEQEVKCVAGRNKFDKATITPNAYINTSGAVVTGATDYCASDWIKVSTGNIVWGATSDNGYSLSIYDSSKTFVRAVGRTNNNAMVIPIANGEEYIRFTILNADLNTMQIEEGSTAHPYLPYNTIQETIRGKNYFKYNTTELYTTGQNGAYIIQSGIDTNYIQVTQQNNGYYVNSYVNTGYRWYSVKTNLPKNTQLKFLCGDTNVAGASNVRLYGYNSLANAQVGTEIARLSNNTSFNTGDYNYYLLSLYPYTAGTYIKDIMIMDNSNNDTTYEPYVTPRTYQFSLGNNKFYKIGDYADELLYDVDEDKVYKKGNVGKIILSGENESWVKSGTTTNNMYLCTIDSVIDNSLKPATNNQNANLLSNYFISNSVNSISVNGLIAIGMRSDGLFAVGMSLSGVATKEGFIEWLSTHNVVVCYRLETPTLTEITGTLKDQIKALYYSQSYNGTTIIESNGDLPMIIKVRALKGE